MALGAFALALAATAAATQPAAAQLFFEPFAYRFQYPPPERDAEPPMRPREAMDAARSQGFEPVGRPSVNHDVYVFDARDSAGRPVRVIMDAYEGEILRVMGRVDAPRRGGRTDLAPGAGRDDGPRVIEGVGPDDAAARPRRDSQAPRPRTPKREAAAPTRPEPQKPIQSRPLAPPHTNDAARPAAQPETPALAATQPSRPPPAPPPTTPPAPPIAQQPTQAPTEAPGPIPSPPFASGAYSKPPAPKTSAAPTPAMPPVAPLDEVTPRVKATPAVPPATLE